MAGAATTWLRPAGRVAAIRCRSLAPPRPQQQQRHLSVSRAVLSAPRRPSGLNAGFSSTYDPGEDDGRGPMFTKAKFGVPQFYPRDLKKRVDAYVIGQDRAKKIISATIFNHYQRLRRKHHQEDAARLRSEKLQRQRFARDRDLHERYRESSSLDEDFASQFDPFEPHTSASYRPPPPPEPAETLYLAEDTQQPVQIDKSNLLLLGPTGVGKTYILDKKLNVPFTISDCNSFTQAGYIGQDVETCIERLLIEANYDTRAAEHGIVVLDEFDKIARRETAHGRDVSGEGVQQALLKLVEGTKVTVNVKDGRGPTSSSSPSSSSSAAASSRSATPITSTYGSPAGGPPPAAPSSPGKADQYIIDTSNILFVFSGAFVGLEDHVLRRVARPSMGFGSTLRVTQALGEAGGTGGAGGNRRAVLPASAYAHLPHQPHQPHQPAGVSDGDAAATTTAGFTPLDLAGPLDLQAFGFIPELIGRLHNVCALAPLTLDELYRILTEPRNSLVQQYTALFETYPSRLAFTRRALRAMAARAAANETGARGLKMEMERVLAEPMFDAPMPYVLITEGCVQGRERAAYWGKDGRFEAERRLRDEDEGLDEGGGGGGGAGGAGGAGGVSVGGTFEQLRQAGQSGA